MSDYINKSALIKAIDEQVKGWGKQGIVPSLFSAIAIVQNQPTLDEKEIIRKPFERIVERLENSLESANRELKRTIEKNPMQTDFALGYHRATEKALNLVKGECGISE